MSSITNKHKVNLERFLSKSADHQAAVKAGLESYPALPTCYRKFEGHHIKTVTGRCIECSRASSAKDRATAKAKIQARLDYAAQVAAQVAAKRALTK